MTDTTAPSDPLLEEWRAQIIEGFAEYGLPDHMLDGVLRHVLDGVATGGFLTALFEHDFMHAASNADMLNLARFGHWLRFLHHNVPRACHGSPEKADAWRKKGGMRGRA